MSEIEKIKALFPITVELTRKDIALANKWNPKDCKGARLLTKVLVANNIDITKDAFDKSGKILVSWGVRTGTISFQDNDTIIYVSTKEGCNVMNLLEPTTLTLRVVSERERIRIDNSWN